MARLSTIKEEKKKNRSGQGGKKRKKHLSKADATKAMQIDKNKIAYTPKTEAEKAALRSDLIRRLKSGEYEAGYRWHGGRTNVSDKH